MNRTALIVSFVVVLAIGIYLYTKSKGQILAPNNPIITDPLAGSTTKTVSKQNQSTLAQIAGGISNVKTVTDVIKSVSKNIGELITGTVSDAAKNTALDGLADYAAKQVATTTAANSLAGGASFEQAAADAMNATKAYLAEQVAQIGGTTTSAAAPVVEASVGVQLAAAAIPLAIIAWVAYAWGVFDPYDPHAGFQKMTLSVDIPGVGKKGDVLDWIPNDIYDAVNAAPSTDSANQILSSFFAKAKATIEEQAAAAAEIQRLRDLASQNINQPVTTQEIVQNITQKTYGNTTTQKN